MSEWTDEYIKAQLGSIYGASALQYAHVYAIMHRMRNELQSALDDQIEVQQAFDSAFTEHVKEHAALLQKYSAIVDLVNSGDAPSLANLRPNDDLVHEYYQRIVRIVNG